MKKIKQDKIKQIGELVIDYSNGKIDPCSEYVNLKDVIELINTPKHETVEEWEARTGKSYPDDAPVWFKETEKDDKGEWYYYKLDTYKGHLPYGSDGAVSKWKDLNKDNFIVANHHGKPKIEE